MPHASGWDVWERDFCAAYIPRLVPRLEAGIPERHCSVEPHARRSAGRSKYYLPTRGAPVATLTALGPVTACALCCPHFVAVTDVQDCQRTTCVAKTYLMEDLLRWKRW